MREKSRQEKTNPSRDSNPGRRGAMLPHEMKGKKNYIKMSKNTSIEWVQNTVAMSLMFRPAIDPYSTPESYLEKILVYNTVCQKEYNFLHRTVTVQCKKIILFLVAVFLNSWWKRHLDSNSGPFNLCLILNHSTKWRIVSKNDVLRENASLWSFTKLFLAQKAVKKFFLKDLH